MADRREGALVVECGGVGFLVNCTPGTVAGAGERCRVYTHLVVREDAMELFGFLTREEEEMFGRLTTVTGIGPRVAVGILSGLSVRDLQLAVVTGDEKTLTRAPGVGKKLAQRLILELRGKIGSGELTASGGSAPLAALGSGPEGEALEALMALGYTGAEAAAALDKARGQTDDPAELTRLALRAMAGRR